MKTMKTPTMDVVRFTESDVIVASGDTFHEIVTLSNLGNSNFDDNRASGTGFNFTFSDIRSGSIAHLLNLDSSFNNGASEATLRSLVDSTYENDSEGYAAFNHTYEYNNDSKKYVLYNNQ